MCRKAIQHGKPVILPQEYKSLAEMLIYISKKYPQKGITYIDASGKEKFVSYPELVESARKYLKTLYQKGLKPGDMLILEIDNSRDFYNAFWACIFGGIIAAPVTQPKSWDLSSKGLFKLIQIWEVLDKPLVLIEEQNRKYYQLVQDSPKYKDFRFVSIDELNSGEEAEIHCPNPDDLAFLQFSSGSTGIPKGVKLTNKNILVNIHSLADRYETKEDDVVFTWLPHTHDMGLFAQHLTPIVRGCNIMKFSPFTFVRSPYMFLKKITEHKGTWFCCPNFGFDWMVRKIPEERLSTLDLSSIRFALNGAEPISVSVTKSFIEKFGKCGFKENMMLPAYGMAEATVGVCVPIIGNAPRIERIYRSKMINENIAIPVKDENDTDKIEFVHEWYAIDGISIKIADEHGNTLDENMIGEILIKGPSVTSGYYNREDITEKMFVDGWLRTGDLGFMIDNSLIVSGRIKDVLFIRGQNYFATDLEEIIYELGTIPRGDLAFVGLFNDRTQQEELIAYVKYKLDIENFLPLRQSIIYKLNDVLGIEINHVIPISSIPKTTSGKVQRFNLRKNFENGEYDDLLKEITKIIERSQDNGRVINLPQNELEIFLHKSWSKILNIPEHRISVDDSFSALGGNSIKAYQLLDAMEKYMNREIGSEVLVLCKTIRQIAEYLQSMPADSGKSFSNWQSDNKLDINKAVAVTGIALRFPHARNTKEFWDNLCSEKDCISKVSSRRKEMAGNPEWDEWMGELENIDSFDNDFFEISEDEAVFMDPQQRLILETSYEALEDAGLIPGSEEERNIGVYAGISSNTYNQLVINHIEQNGMHGVHKNTLVGNMPNIIAALVAHTYNFTGPALAVDTACSSFLVAVHHAVAAIRQNNIHGAVVAGANILSTPAVHSLARNAGIISSTNYTKVFDKDADGSVLGEGVVVVYLEPLVKAVNENKNIYGVIRGTAINNDGYSLGIMAPNPKGQYKVLADSYKDANLSPNEVSYLEVHGTGTTIGDPIEVSALSKLFSAGNKENAHDIGIGSVKTNIGHLLPAAGGAGLAKLLLSLKNKKLAPSLHMKNINPALQLEKTPFYIVKALEEWLPKDQKTRKAGISSFGLGGTNSHVVLEEWHEGETIPCKQSLQLLTMSAKSEKALERVINQTKDMIKNTPDLDINNLCFTRNRYRKHYSYRAACLISTDKKTEALNSINKGQFLKNRSAKIGLIIGDLKNAKVKKDIAIEQHTNDLFKQSIAEICDCAAGNNIVNPTGTNKNELLFLSYWYTLVKCLKQNGANIFDISGVESGQVLADLLNEKIDLAKALELYFGKNNIISQENDNTVAKSPLLKADIVLCMYMSKENLMQILPENIQSKTQIVNLKPGAQDSFDYKLLTAMSELYVVGADFDWEYIYPKGPGKLISLPPYPFEQKSFWINQLKGDGGKNE